MGRTKQFIFVLLLSPGFLTLSAQRVLYSPFVGSGSDTRFEVAGKAGNFYWVQKSRARASLKNPKDRWLGDKDLRFEIFDARMNLVKIIPTSLGEGLLKEYLVPGASNFDQLLIQRGSQEVFALVNRYSQDGDLQRSADTVAEFPANLKCGDFLLVRSEDKGKIMLIGFETVPASYPIMHVFLYDRDWRLLFQRTYSNQNISKPMVQYEFVEYPLEGFSSCPIKLGNDGGWTMVVSSGTNRNYVLFYFDPDDDKFSFKEIKLMPGTTVEEAGLYLDDKAQDGCAGIMSRVKTTTIKHIRIIHYSLKNFGIDFDTSYSLNTMPTTKRKNENIYEEYFMTVQGRGFMFLKEYGQSLKPTGDDEGNEFQSLEKEDPEPLVENKAPGFLNRDDYTRYSNLAGARSSFERGDLMLYFFPAGREDSCWSGIINKEQITELGKSYLSYVFLPSQDKLFFLYNSFYKNRDQYSSATVLDQKGNPLNEGLEYWKINNTLLFPAARQISENELAIPYARNMRNGFAIIRL